MRRRETRRPFSRRWRSVAVVLPLVVAAVWIAGATAVGQEASSGGYKLVGTWGKTGTGNGQFAPTVHGIAVDKAGNVFIADTDNHRVQVFTAKGGFLRKWGSQGNGNGQFDVAEDIDVAPDGTVWVADQQNARVQAFSSSGTFLTSISTGPDELPRGVAVDADGNVIVATEGSGISGFRKFAKSGANWAPSGGLFGSSKAYRTDDVEVARDGTIYTSTADLRVHRFSADGKPLQVFAVPSLSPGGIGVDLDCNVWVPDFGVRRIEKYSPSGKLLATASVPDLSPNDIAVGPKGDVYAIFQGQGIVHFAPDSSTPVRAVVGPVAVSRGVAKVKYTLTGIACPAQIAATASLTGKGISGKASVKVGAGKTTVLSIPVKAAKGSGTATFKIVLKTNGRPTTQTANVTIRVP